MILFIYSLIFIMIFNQTDNIKLNETGDITVTIKDFKNNRGNVLISLFNSNKGFPNDYTKSFKGTISNIENNNVKYIFKDIPFGTYAISVLHDENNNKKADTNFLGIPKEGIGISNNKKIKFGPPKFDDAKFLLNMSKLNVDIKIVYL